MKRARGSNGPFVVQRSAKRPIDKALVVVNQSTTGTQQKTDLLTTTFPCTVTGLRWSLTAFGSATGEQLLYWAVVIIRDGLSASTIATSDGASLYDPEQNVLAFGVVRLADRDAGAGPICANFEGSTKSMRKMMGGDKLSFISITDGNTINVDGCVQYFCKS